MKAKKKSTDLRKDKRAISLLPKKLSESEIDSLKADLLQATDTFQKRWSKFQTTSDLQKLKLPV